MLREKYTIEDMQEYARSHDGKCLSNKYISTGEKLEWLCKQGHTWKNSFATMKQHNTWCRKCYNIEIKQKAYYEIEAIAKLKGWRILEMSSRKNKLRFKLQCSKGHCWESVKSDLKKGKGCILCYRQNLKEKTTLKIKNTIKLNGGTILTEEGFGHKIKVKIKCKNNHEFITEGKSITANKWCPYCCSSRSEDICRTYLEQLLNNKFPKIRPNWLINPKTGARLELDGYCKDLKIAFEHQGKHHYFNNDPIILETQKYRDSIKKEICQQQGILLLEIPELFIRTKLENLRNLIKDFLIKNNITCSLDFDYKEINFLTLTGVTGLQTAKDLASARGGECLSKVYLNGSIKLDWRCKEGHHFKMHYSSAQQNHWCPICNDPHPRKTIEDAKQLANSRGFTCLSINCKNGKDLLEWKCKNENHPSWITSFSGIANNKSGCPKCSRIKLTIQDAQKLVKEPGGLCLSTEYISNTSKLKWQCSKGHIFYRSYSNMKQNKVWCIECNKNV